MFEGKNIHYSVDSKLLCSHSAKLCKSRRLNGFGFCSRHILEDHSAPFKQCAHVRNKHHCAVPIQLSKHSNFCSKHAAVVKQQISESGSLDIPRNDSTSEHPNAATLINDDQLINVIFQNGLSNGTEINDVEPQLIGVEGVSSPTPPSTPTHEPALGIAIRMSLVDRIKNKFTRVQNCSKSEDFIVNVEDDLDPYAFPDHDQSARMRSFPVQSHDADMNNSSPFQVSYPESCPQSLSITSSEIPDVALQLKPLNTSLSSPKPLISALVSPTSSVSSINSLFSFTRNAPPCGTNTLSINTAGLPPTPPSGETPIARMYPELLGKLHASPLHVKQAEHLVASTLTPERIPVCDTKHTTESYQVQGGFANIKNTEIYHMLQQDDIDTDSSNGLSDLKESKDLPERTISCLSHSLRSESPLIKQKLLKKQEPVTNLQPGKSRAPVQKKKLVAAQKTAQKSGGQKCGANNKSNQGAKNNAMPQGGSYHSSRTMNKLQNKIAQNKIQDKIRSKAKQREASSPHSGALSLMSTLPTAAVQTGLSSSVTSTIFSLGSIPSLGTFLSNQQQQALCVSTSDLQESGGDKCATQLALPLALPFFAPKSALLSPSQDQGNVPLVIPATVFTPFPHLAGALNNLQGQNTEASKSQNSVTTKLGKNSKLKSKGIKVAKVSKEGLKLTIKKGSNKKKRKKIKPAVVSKLGDGIPLSQCVNLKSETLFNEDGFAKTDTTSEVLQNSSQIKETISGLHGSALKPVPKVKPKKKASRKPNKQPGKAVSQRPTNLPLKSDNNDLILAADNLPQRTKNDPLANKKAASVKNALNAQKQDLDIQTNNDLRTESVANKTEKLVSSKAKTKAQNKDRSISYVSSRLKRVNEELLSEFEIKKKFRRKSAWNYYKLYAEERRHNAVLLPFGVESSESDECTDTWTPLASQYLSSPEHDSVTAQQDPETTNTQTSLHDPNLISTLRTTHTEVVKCRMRRRCSQLRRHNKSRHGYHSDKRAGLEALLAVAKRDATLAADLVLATDPGAKQRKVTIRQKQPSLPEGAAVKKCLCEIEGSLCGQSALPYTNHCMKHIMQNPAQQLYDSCTAKFSNNTQCSVAVLDIAHELPLCPEHAQKADNYQKTLEEKQIRKPRKKTKQSALTRPPRKGKKRRKKPVLIVDSEQHVTSPDVTLERMTSSDVTLDGVTSDHAKEEEFDVEKSLELRRIEKGEGLETNLASLPRAQSEFSQDEEQATPTRDVTEPSASSDVIAEISTGLDSDIDEQFSPGMIEKNLDLPLDLEDATKLLDKMPVEAFDLFAAVSEKPEQLSPSREDTDMLEKALAEASSEINQSATSADVTCVVTSRRMREEQELRVHSNPPTDYMSDSEPYSEEKEDELTKQIACSLMQRNALSGDEEDVLDAECFTNLASSLTPQDLRSISQVLGSEIDMALMAAEQTSNTSLASNIIPTVTCTNNIANQITPIEIKPEAAQNIPFQNIQFTPSYELISSFPGQHQVAASQPISIGDSNSLQDSVQLAQLLTNEQPSFRNQVLTSQNLLQENIRSFLNTSTPEEIKTEPVNTQVMPVNLENIATSTVTTSHSILHGFLTQPKESGILSNYQDLKPSNMVSNHILPSQREEKILPGFKQEYNAATLMKTEAAQNYPISTSHTEVNLEQVDLALKLKTAKSSKKTINQLMSNPVDIEVSKSSKAKADSGSAQSFMFSLPDCRTPGVPNVSLKPTSRSNTGANSIQPSAANEQALQQLAAALMNQQMVAAANQNAVLLPSGLSNQNTVILPSGLTNQGALLLSGLANKNALLLPTNNAQSAKAFVLPDILKKQNTILLPNLSAAIRSAPTSVNQNTLPFAPKQEISPSRFKPYSEKTDSSTSISTPNGIIAQAANQKTSKETFLANQNAASLPAPIMSSRPSISKPKARPRNNGKTSSLQALPKLGPAEIDSKSNTSNIIPALPSNSIRQSPHMPMRGTNNGMPVRAFANVNPMSKSSQPNNPALMGQIMDAMRCQMPPNAVVSMATSQASPLSNDVVRGVNNPTSQQMLARSDHVTGSAPAISHNSILQQVLSQQKIGPAKHVPIINANISGSLNLRANNAMLQSSSNMIPNQELLPSQKNKGYVFGQGNILSSKSGTKTQVSSHKTILSPSESPNFVPPNVTITKPSEETSFLSLGAQSETFPMSPNKQNLLPITKPGEVSISITATRNTSLQPSNITQSTLPGNITMLSQLPLAVQQLLLPALKTQSCLNVANEGLETTHQVVQNTQIPRQIPLRPAGYEAQGTQVSSAPVVMATPSLATAQTTQKVHTK